MECDAKTQWYRDQFTRVWPDTFISSLGTTRDGGQKTKQTWLDFRAFRSEWRDYERSCKARVPGWYAGWGTEVEEYGLRRYCDQNGERFQQIFQVLSTITPGQRDAFVEKNYGINRSHSVADVVRWYENFRNDCNVDLSMPWAPPNIEKILGQMQTVSR